MIRVFISYSRKDSTCADQLRLDLEKAGCFVWKDTEKIPFGSRWTRAIERGIEQSDVVIIVWSRNAAQSFWVEAEIVYANRYKKPIIPACIDEAPLSLPLVSFQTLYLEAGCYDAARQILPVLTTADSATVPSSTQSEQEAQARLFRKLEFDAQRREDLRRDHAAIMPKHVINSTVRPDMGDVFFDRASAIAWIRKTLVNQDTRLVAIIGRDGYGKTALVGQALSDAEHGMMSLEDVDLPVVGVAYFHPGVPGMTLAQICSDLGKLLGENYVSSLMDIANSEQPPDTKAHRLLIELVNACEDRGNIFIVMDGLEKVLDRDGNFKEPYKEIGHWLERCLKNDSPVKLIVTSGRDWSMSGIASAFVKQLYLNEGLPDSDAMALLRKLAVKDFGQTEAEMDLLRKIVGLTQGVPYAVERVGGLLKQRKPRQWRALAEDAARFDKEITSALSEYVYGQQQPVEQRIMEVLATFRSPVPEPAIDYVLQGQVDSEVIESTLNSLEDGYFVGYHDEHESWWIHDLDRRAILAKLRTRPDDLQLLHQRAAQYYQIAGLDDDRLNAVYHFQEAGDYGHAADLATIDIWTLITHGQSVELRQRLEQFSAELLDTAQWIKVQVNLGDIYKFLSEIDLARTSYQSALHLLESSEQSPEMSILTARVCLGLGDLARQTSLSEAYAWLQKGMEAVDGVAEPLLMAELQIKMGTVQAEMRHYADGIQMTNAGLARLPEGDSQLRVRGLINLGRSYFWGENDIVRGRSFTKDAYDMAERITDWFWSFKALNNLALFCDISGQWTDAIEMYELALEKANLIGSPPAESLQLANNLSVLYTNMGIFTKAEEQVKRAESIARAHGLERDLAYVLAGRADLAERQENWNEAASCLAEAEQLMETTAAEELKPELYYLWSNAHRGLRQLHKAAEYAERSMALAEDPMSDGKALRALAQALLAKGQVEPAIAAFEKSRELLTEQDPYETARTQEVYGQVLVDCGDLNRGQELLRQAQSTFDKLGVKVT